MPIGRLTSEADLRRFIESEMRRPGAIPVTVPVAKIKAGVPSDADFPETPANGTLAVNSSTSKLYCRINNEWKVLE